MTEAIAPTRSGRRPGLGRIATVFACGAALFSDGYINAAAGPSNAILSAAYPDQWAAKNASKLFTSLVFAGTVLGMLLFGYLSDRVGRKFGMIFASLWLALWSVMAGLAWGAGGSIGGMISALIAYRFIVGIGIGAEYPGTFDSYTGSVAAAENSEDSGVSKGIQHRIVVLATNSMIDAGFVLANFVAYLLLQIFGEDHIEWVWRLTLGLGAVFPLSVLYFRLQMQEPEVFRENSMTHIPIHKLPWGLIMRKYWHRLLAVSLAWFLYDWVAYPGGIFSSVLVDEAIGDNGTLSQTLGWDVLTNAFYLPGTIAGALVIDRLGPKWTMITGLLCQTLVGVILSGAYEKIKTSVAGFAIVYGIYLSFGEFGPGNCLGLLAAKASGPTAVRGIFYGIAAAIGKVGAFAGSYVFTPIINDVGGAGTYKGDTVPVWIGSGFALLSAAIVFFLVPDVREDFMKQEDIRFRQYLTEAGYDMSGMGIQGLLGDDELAVDSVKESPVVTTKPETKSM